MKLAQTGSTYFPTMPSHLPSYSWTAFVDGEPRCALRSLTGFLERGRGLLGYPELPQGHGFYFPRCRSIHTWFMSRPIDVVALDASHVIVAVLPEVRPWRMPPFPKTTRHIVELRTGEAERLALTPHVKLEIAGP